MLEKPRIIEERRVCLRVRFRGSVVEPLQDFVPPRLELFVA